MPYSAEISRVNPTCLLFVIDQSGSMDEKLASGRTKSDFVADVLNKTLYQLVIRCTRDSDAEKARDYFDIGVIAYGGSGVRSGFEGELASGILHPLSAIGQSPKRIDERKKKVDDGAGGLTEQSIRFPVWFDPRNEGGTPMCEALRQAAEVLVSWCDAHPQCYPPTVLHVTDGQSTDGDPEELAQHLAKIATHDGESLLFNLHIAAGASLPVVFPGAEDALPDAYSRLLFRMSSAIPPHLVGPATDKGYPVSPDSRFFAYNAGLEGIVDFFEIGTRATQLR